MKLSLSKLFLFLALLLATLVGCETDNDDNDNVDEELYVKFINNASSEYTISSIQIFNMGVAGTLEEPNGEFEDNILEDGVSISPGEYVFFYLEIPNLHYAYYRLGVDNGAGGDIIIHDQVGYTNSHEGIITHWGSDERTVSVTIVENEYTGLIGIQSWSDNAGIE